MSEAKEKRRLRIAIFHCGFVYSGGGERIVLEEVMGLDHLRPYRAGVLSVATFLGVLLFVILGGFLMKRSLFQLGQAIHLKGPSEVILPSLAGRPFWDSVLGALVSLVAALFLLFLMTRLTFLERVSTFLPQLLGNMRRRRWHRHRRR